MSQDYPVILSSETLQNSRQKFLDRDDALRSAHSGTVFPTLDTVVGMFCLRTDQNCLYMLETDSPISWQLIADMSKTAISQEAADARYANVTGDKLTGSLTLAQGVWHMYESTAAFLRWRHGYDGAIWRLDRYSAAGAYVNTPIFVNDAGEVTVEGARVQARLGYTPLNSAGGDVGGLRVLGPAGTTSDSTSMLTLQTATSGSGDGHVASLGFVIPSAFGVKLSLRADGYVTLGGWSAAAHRWYVATTTGDMVAAGNVIAYSDRRLKKNVKRIRGALDLILQMRGVIFDRKDTGARQIGVIAQEIETLVPELVIQPPKGKGGPKYKGVAYGNFAALFIEAIKELSREVQSLRSEQADARRRMAEIERRL